MLVCNLPNHVTNNVTRTCYNNNNNNKQQQQYICVTMKQSLLQQSLSSVARGVWEYKRGLTWTDS